MSAPEGERLLPGGREEGVVDHDERAGGAPEGCAGAMSVMRSSGLLGVSIHSRAAGLGKRGGHGGLVAEIHELDLALAAAAPGIERAGRCRRSSRAAR